MESNQGPYQSQEPDSTQSAYPQQSGPSAYPQGPTQPPYEPAGYPPGALYGQGPQPADQQYLAPTGYPLVPPQVVYMQQRSTNGLAVASMVLGIVWIYWIGSILALIFGYIARRQIKERGQNGDGMAIAGIVLGWVGVGVAVVLLVIALSAIASVGGVVTETYGS